VLLQAGQVQVRVVHAAVRSRKDDPHAGEEALLHVPPPAVLLHGEVVREDSCRHQGAGRRDEEGSGEVEADGRGERDVRKLKTTFS